MTAAVVGAVLALAVGLLFSALGMDRDRAFYPVVAIVVASYYVLFAAIGADARVLLSEVLVSLVFIALAITGFKRSLWLAAAALAVHGGFDLVHGALISNPGMPAWWPGFCAAFDVVIAVYLAGLLLSGRRCAAA